MSAWTLCVYCGDEATVNDHVVPLAQGGRITMPACKPCNASKGGRTPTQWLISLLLKGVPHRVFPRAPVLHELGLIDSAEIARAVSTELATMRQKVDDVEQMFRLTIEGLT